VIQDQPFWGRGKHRHISLCLPTIKETGRFVVEAPAFMRGKERLSAPAKSRDFDHALERWQYLRGFFLGSHGDFLGLNACSPSN
jgi:hypothetical protein